MPTQPMSDSHKLPPQNIEAEQSLLGCLLIDQEAMVRVADQINPEDFYRPAHQKIFEGMIDLFERHDPIDILSLGNRLEEKTWLQQVGGRAYLVELSNMEPTSANITHSAEIVQKKATLRRLLQTASDIENSQFMRAIM